MSATSEVTARRTTARSAVVGAGIALALAFAGHGSGCYRHVVRATGHGTDQYNVYRPAEESDVISETFRDEEKERHRLPR